MCGVPFHAADVYIGKLIEKGYKVAVCEQMEDPALAKGLVKREVIRVVTPGTVIESALLPEQRKKIIGLREHKFGFEGMIKAEDAELFPEGTAPISLEEIMLHIERGEDDEKSVI